MQPEILWWFLISIEGIAQEFSFANVYRSVSGNNILIIILVMTNVVVLPKRKIIESREDKKISLAEDKFSSAYGSLMKGRK
jgi:hypothetical protein